MVSTTNIRQYPPYRQYEPHINQHYKLNIISGTSKTTPILMMYIHFLGKIQHRSKPRRKKMMASNILKCEICGHTCTQP